MLHLSDHRFEDWRGGRHQRYQYAVCGFGPAGSGFLLHALKSGLLGRMADEGLVVIDRAASVGPGSIGQYRLTGNSLATAFIDCIDAPGYRPLFDDLRARNPVVRAMRAIGAAAPPLDLTAAFLEIMVERLAERLTRDYGIPILRSTEIRRIARQDSGGYRIDLRDRTSGRESAITACEVISACGGRQSPDVVATDPLTPGLILDPWRERLLMSDDFLRVSDEAIRDAVPLGGASRDVIVVGGSHSAMSTVDRLAQALGPAGLRRITLLHRSPIRLYYASVEEGLRDGYAFDETADVCPMSGRVNRFGGMRYRSFAVARSILTTGRTPEQPIEVRLTRLTRESLGRHRVLDLLDRAPAIITCLGYQANLPRLVESNGEPIGLDNTPTGLRVDSRGQALRTCGRPLPDFYAIGLGSKLLRRSETIGGEPSFTGQADGVWLYQNHGAIPVIRSIADRARLPLESSRDRQGAVGFFGGERAATA